MPYINQFVNITKKKSEKSKISIRTVCKILGISKLSFTSWLTRPKSKQQLHKEAVQNMILDIYQKAKKHTIHPK